MVLAEAPTLSSSHTELYIDDYKVVAKPFDLAPGEATHAKRVVSEHPVHINANGPFGLIKQDLEHKVSELYVLPYMDTNTEIELEPGVIFTLVAHSSRKGTSFTPSFSEDEMEELEDDIAGLDPQYRQAIKDYNRSYTAFNSPIFP